MKTETKEVKAVPGAATYFAFGNEVWMREPDGYESHIDTKATRESAAKSVISWQKKENRAVLKTGGQI